MVFNTQILLGVLASVAGSVGGAKQSSVISEASQKFSKSLIVEPSETGGLPKISPHMPAPSISVGAGGSGNKSVQPERSPQTLDKSLSDQVGEMADDSVRATETAESASVETILKERSPDEPPNPKKRMWEDSTSGSTQAKDEL